MSEQVPEREMTMEEFVLLLEDLVRVGIHVRDQLHILNTHLANNVGPLPGPQNGQVIEECGPDTPVQ